MKFESDMEVPAGPFDDEGLRARRLGQLAVVVMTALCTAGLVGLVRQDWRTLSFIAAALVFIGFSMGLARRRRVTAAALLLLWTLALIASAAMMIGV